VHRVSLSVPNHYFTLEKKEIVSNDQLAYEKVKELEAKYFDEEGQLEAVSNAKLLGSRF